jgi:tRNA pseudouridine38-40 synthase
MDTLYLRATIAYDGTDFLGFQWQTTGRTVQGVLETALAQVTQATPRVVAAGRTDTGVHAQGQVIGFHVPWQHPLADLQRALNAVLPADVAVLTLGPAEPGWHPRFSAVRRTYRYTVLNRPIRSPLDRRYAHLVAAPLDPARLQAAAALLVGEHDFASFGQPTQGENTMPETTGRTVRVIFSAAWRRADDRFTFDVIGNAFLRGMVRRMVGCTLQVGLGCWSVERLAALLAARERSLSAPPAPACGLCLMQVDYE